MVHFNTLSVAEDSSV